jgi:hypothetical protein
VKRLYFLQEILKDGRGAILFFNGNGARIEVVADLPLALCSHRRKKQEDIATLRSRPRRNRSAILPLASAANA